MKLAFDHDVVINSWDVLELDLLDKKAYIKDQGMNTHDIVRFRVVDDERSVVNNSESSSL